MWSDLPEKESRAVENHLAVCKSCRELLAEFHLVQNVLRNSIQDPDPADLVEVRERVLAEVQHAPERKLEWRFAGLALALASTVIAVFIVGVGHRTTTDQPPARTMQAKTAKLPFTVSKPVTESLNTPKLASHRVRARHLDRGIRAITLMAQAGHAPMLKLATFDPDVVILWEPTGRIQHE